MDHRKREEIRKYILGKIAVNDRDFIDKTMDNFDISPESVGEFIDKAIECKAIMKDVKADCQYRLIEHVKEEQIDLKRNRHSGEGIFFSSKVMSEFGIWSDARIYKFGYGQDMKVIEHRLLAYASRLQDIGTLVMMTLENETSRKLSEVFDMYTDIDEGFIRTRIPVKEACLSGEPVARSQARRICNRLDEFKEVVLDFSRVELMGQGFADEIFRVFTREHPQVTVRPVNMTPEVERMIRHVSRGHIPENVCLSESSIYS